MLLVNELKQHPGKLNPGSSSLGIRRRPPLPIDLGYHIIIFIHLQLDYISEFPFDVE